MKKILLSALFTGAFALTLLMHCPARIYAVAEGAGEANARASGVTRTLFGFTPFPYDFTAEAVATVRETTVPHSTLWALHFDHGIPWKEMLADAPLPARVQKEWDDARNAIPPDHVVYLGLAPLATDRQSLAPATGEAEHALMPDELKGAAFDSPLVKRAWLAYVRRAVREFHPRYLNLGIEAGGVLLENPERWAQFERLYDSVRTAMKAESPEMQIGISFSLGRLRTEGPAKTARSLIAKSDYVGLSFYPTASGFDEKFGLPPYGSGADAWRKPLAWVRAYTDKPLALCETGYTTQRTELPAFHLQLEGDEAGQAEYVRELFEIARRDRYTFVVWFLAIDYDKLYAKMPAGSEVMKLWKNVGLLDGEAHPKPAWDIWKAGVEKSRGGIDR